MKDILQLIKKENNQEYKDIYPKTYTDAVLDKHTGANLADILNSFNMYFIAYAGSKEVTRVLVPTNLRRKGLWITYIMLDDTIVTEYYNGSLLTDDAWLDSANWVNSMQPFDKFSKKNMTCRFDNFTDKSTSSKLMTVKLGGEIVFSTTDNRFYYLHRDVLYAYWEVKGKPSNIEFQYKDSVYTDKLFLCKDRAYVMYNSTLVDIARFTIDKELSLTSNNPIANSTVTKRINEVNADVTTALTLARELKEEGRFLINGNVTNNPDEEDITVEENKLKFKDKVYNAGEFSGLGRVYLRKNIVNGKNVLTQEMINKANTIYIIQYDYDLDNKEINIPENCTLDFQGGSFKNGILNGNGTIINSNNTNIFKDVNLKNKFISDIGIFISWWVKNDTTDNTEDVQRAFDSILSFDCKKLIIDKPITIKDISFVNKYNPNIIITGDLNSNKQHLYDIKVIGESSQGIDISGTTGIVFKDLTFFGSSGTESFQNAPKCVLYMSRTYTNNSGGNHSFYNVSFRGYSTVSHIYNYAGESNNCIDCKFINNNKTESMQQLVYYTSINSLNLESKFDNSISLVNPCTDSRFIRCSFIGTNETKGIYIEGSPTIGINKNNVLNINIDTCYFYLEKGISAEFKDIQGALNIHNCIDEGGSQISTEGKPLFKISTSVDNYNVRNVSIIGNTFYPRKNSDIINTLGTVLRGFTALSNHVFSNHGMWRFNIIAGGYMTFANLGNEKIIVENYSIDFEVKTSNIDSIKDNIVLNNKDYLYYNRKDLNPTDIGAQRYYKQDIYNVNNHQTDIPCWWDGRYWKNALGKSIGKSYGATVERISPILDEDTGWMFANTEFNRIEYYMKDRWIDALGNPIGALKKGTTAQRPTGVQIGFTYKDTDLNKWIIWNGEAWENIDGTALG